MPSSKGIPHLFSLGSGFLVGPISWRYLAEASDSLQLGQGACPHTWGEAGAELPGSLPSSLLCQAALCLQQSHPCTRSKMGLLPRGPPTCYIYLWASPDGSQQL